jgi:hypothetical protein
MQRTESAVKYVTRNHSLISSYYFIESRLPLHFSAYTISKIPHPRDFPPDTLSISFKLNVFINILLFVRPLKKRH